MTGSMGCWGLQACLLCLTKWLILDLRQSSQSALGERVQSLLWQSRQACKPQQPMTVIHNIQWHMLGLWLEIDTNFLPWLSIAITGAVKRQNAEPPNGRTKSGIGLILQEGVSWDAEHNGEIQNAVTSCLARQTWSDSICLSFIDRSVPFSQEGGFSGCQTQWWSPKFRHPVSLSKQEVTAFSCRLIDWYAPFSQQGDILTCRTQWWSLKCCHFLFRSPKRKRQHFPAVYWWWHWNRNDKSFKCLYFGTRHNNHYPIQSDFNKLL